ncbi:MAG: hypothetical protein KF853_16015 [Rhodocyclaceae bacterium]|nr:hypothetical protein [Rhodocyclaceae bacterium]MBX3678521.1 hypothetical protein [Rhodocyclaceae bacterium]
MAKLTFEQRIALAYMLHKAFVYLRSPGYAYFWDKPDDQNNPVKLQTTLDRSIAIGEALHNMPLDILQSDFNFEFHKNKIAQYADIEPLLTSFIADLEEIESMNNDLMPCAQIHRH